MRWRLPVFAWPKVRVFVLPSLYVARWRPITRRYQARFPCFLWWPVLDCREHAGLLSYLCYNRTQTHGKPAMTEQTHISMRLSEDLLERVDAYRLKLQRAMRQPVSRAAALRALLEHGLDAVEVEAEE